MATISLILCLTSVHSFNVTSNPYINLYRGMNKNGHWASSLVLPPAGFTIEATFKISKYSDSDTTLYYECTANGLNNFVTKDPKCEGQIVLSLLGYIYKNPIRNFTTPIYRCFIPEGTPFIPNDHFISMDINCEQKGLKNEGLLGYVSFKKKNN